MPERKVSRGRPRRQPSRAQPKPCTAPTVNAATESEVPGLEAETLFLPSQIEHLVVSGLTPNPRNARTHTKQQVHHISASIRTFGFTNPVLIDAEGTIIAGHRSLYVTQGTAWYLTFAGRRNRALRITMPA